jgi:hypothetical protein
MNDSGLASRSERRIQPPGLQASSNRQRGIFLPQGTIGSNRQEPFSATLFAGADRDIIWRHANVDEPSAKGLGGHRQLRDISKSCVHTGHDIEPRAQSVEHRGKPMLRDCPARSGHADQERTRTSGIGFRGAKPFETGGHRSAGQDEFADATVGCPIAQPKGSLGISPLNRIAEK